MGNPRASDRTMYRLWKRYHSGERQCDLATEIGYTGYTLWSRWRNLGLPPRTINQKTKDNMIAAYLRGDTLREAAEKFGYSATTCLRILRENGIATRRSRLSRSEQMAITGAYLNGDTVINISKKFNRSSSACRHAIKRQGIKLRGDVHRKYRVDESVFEIIDTEEKAYWLGFISADGTVTDHLLTIILQARDKKHLEKFKKFIRSDHPIVETARKVNGKIHYQTRLLIGSTKILNDLKEYGIVPNKTKIIKPPHNLSDHLMRHYWRGVFDGDGSIVKSIQQSQKSYRWNVTLWGNRFMLSGFKRYLETNINSGALVRPARNIFTICYGGKAVPRSVVIELYGDASVYLDRKMKLAKELMASPDLDTHSRPQWSQTNKLRSEKKNSCGESYR